MINDDTDRMPCMSCGQPRGDAAPASCFNVSAHTPRCAVPACRGVVRTLTRVLEDGDPEPYGYCSTCGLAVTN